MGSIIINDKKIEIVRKNIVLSDADNAYIDLCNDIMTNGSRTHNRTGIDTIAIAGWNHKFDLSKAFPILETKDVKINNATNEIQWIHQVQSNKVNWLHERGNNTWDLWNIDEDGIYRIYEQGENAVNDPEREVPLKVQMFDRVTGDIIKADVLDKYNKPIMVKSKDVIDGKTKARTIKEAILFGKEYAGTIGEAYGFINHTYKRPQCVEHTLKVNPTDRRMNINLWQDAHLAKAVLPSCVWSSEYKVTPDGKLHSYVHQRSADVPAGLPFNISQYAVLLSMFAKATGYEVGTMSWSIMDAHIYVNQIEKIKIQMQRREYMKEVATMAAKSSDEEINNYYDKIIENWNRLHHYARNIIGPEIDQMKMSERIEYLKMNDKEEFSKEYKEAFEKKACFEHMLTRETPELELASHDSIFEYSTDYVDKKDPYMKENPVGNKEIILKKYHPTPFISMPIAQ